MDRVPKIDFHTHLLERRAAGEGMPNSAVSGFGARTVEAPPGSAQEAADRACYDMSLHIEMLDRLGLDAEVLSSMSVIQTTSWASPKHEVELIQLVNDEIARWVAAHPSRFIGCFSLPLQDAEHTTAELERCVEELAMKVVQLPAAVNGAYLSAPQFQDLWATIEERGLVAFMHPDGTRDPWFQQYSMWNSVGQPIEEAKFIASLIYEGVLERHSELKLVIAHGGGYLPHYFGRLDRNVKAWPKSAENISKRPSEYLRHLYYDTCLYESAMLQALAARVGADRLVMGSDFPVGETDPVGFIERQPDLSPAEVAGITGRTAAELLRVAPLNSRGLRGLPPMHT